MTAGNPRESAPNPSSDSVEEEVVERFRPTSGRITAALGLVLAGAVVVVGLVELDRGFPEWLIAVAVLGAVLTWASMLRPALWATREQLVMRNMLDTVHIPLAGIESWTVRQVLVVLADDRRFVSTVLGRSWRRVALGNRRAKRQEDGRQVTELPYVDWAEQRLAQLVDDARAAAGVRVGTREQIALGAGVRREPAWLPIGLVAAALLAVVVTLLV